MAFWRWTKKLIQKYRNTLYHENLSHESTYCKKQHEEYSWSTKEHSAKDYSRMFLTYVQGGKHFTAFVISHQMMQFFFMEIWEDVDFIKPHYFLVHVGSDEISVFSIKFYCY
jgi:hypothetical protein